MRFRDIFCDTFFRDILYKKSLRKVSRIRLYQSYMYSFFFGRN